MVVNQPQLLPLAHGYHCQAALVELLVTRAKGKHCAGDDAILMCAGHQRSRLAAGGAAGGTALDAG